MLQEKIKNILKVKKIFEKSYPLKDEYNVEIPLNIYQTWHTKKLPSGMAESVEIIKILNPRFNHYLFDDNDCREFIQNNFDPSVLHAYNSLIPGAYKADLWRYCILYIKGGLYLDIKLKCINGFKLIELTEKEHFVKDRLSFGIYNALMVCKAGNPLLLKAINKIVENVKNRYYGPNALSPTGPKLLGDIIQNSNYKKNVDLLHYSRGGYVIYKKRFVISTEYPQYNNERTNTYKNLKTKRYDALWNERNVYK
jgi:mannosyltransferase OCH1-like enzyme